MGRSELTHLFLEAALRSVPRSSIHSFSRGLPGRAPQLKAAPGTLTIHPFGGESGTSLDGWHLCDYPHPTIYLRCGLKTNQKKLVNQDFSASVLVTKADLGARSFSVVGTAVHAGMFSGIAGFRPLGASNRLPQPNPAVRAKNVSGCLSNVL